MKNFITLLILTICFILKGVTTFSLTNNYEIKVNSKINEISNIEVRNFLKKEIDGNKYIYVIKIRQSFPDDYNVQIHLNDPRLEQIRYTGTFSLEQDIMDVFRIIDYEKQFAFKRVKRDIFITHK